MLAMLVQQQFKSLNAGSSTVAGTVEKRAKNSIRRTVLLALVPLTS